MGESLLTSGWWLMGCRVDVSPLLHPGGETSSSASLPTNHHQLAPLHLIRDMAASSYLSWVISWFQSLFWSKQLEVSIVGLQVRLSSLFPARSSCSLSLASPRRRLWPPAVSSRLLASYRRQRKHGSGVELTRAPLAPVTHLDLATPPSARMDGLTLGPLPSLPTPLPSDPSPLTFRSNELVHQSLSRQTG